MADPCGRRDIPVSGPLPGPSPRHLFDQACHDRGRDWCGMCPPFGSTIEPGTFHRLLPSRANGCR